MNTENSQKNSVLLLHGWGSSHKSWEEVRKTLADKGIDVIIPDIPGFGDNPPPDKPWNGKDYENWVLNYIEENKLAKPIILMGHSFGGGLAIKLTVTHPELVEKLVLISAARMKKPKSIYKKFVGFLAKVGKPLGNITIFRKIFYKFVVREKDYIRTSGVMRETFRNVIKEDLTNEVGKIKTPTLIIWGNKDSATPVKDAYFINHEIENSKLEILKNYDHDLNLKAPEKLAEIIYNFIK